MFRDLSFRKDIHTVLLKVADFNSAYFAVACV